MYINHIDKFTDAQAIQDALDNGTLANPYVAMTTAGTLDYNTLEPTPPAPATMGTWSDDGQGVYTFQITETGTTYWDVPVKIGVLNGVYMDGTQDSPNVMLSYTIMDDTWHMEFASEHASTPAEHDFSEADPYWDSGVMTDPDESTSAIFVVYDGTDTFTFQHADGFLTTINPEYPAGE